MTNVHFFISGRVQGVGFRRFVASQANKNDLTGFVRNTDDNRVEVFAQGETKDIAPFIYACQKGPLFANVTDVYFVEDKKTLDIFDNGCSGFVILR